ncbi:MAG: hypothetical protein LE178_06210 [Endomicrobium sp.]|nr:hypothetical protein [Endomicrobium sp.]
MKIPNRIDHDEINSHKTIGQLETDMIVGKGKNALKVVVERNARITKIRKVNDKDRKEKERERGVKRERKF